MDNELNKTKKKGRKPSKILNDDDLNKQKKRHQYYLNFKEKHPGVLTKSGLMLGVGETQRQVVDVLKDLREHDVDMLTLGQYLQPSRHHLAVEEYITPQQFEQYKDIANELGFSQVASGPMVRSSYHADLQAKGELVN